MNIFIGILFAIGFSTIAFFIARAAFSTEPSLEGPDEMLLGLAGIFVFCAFIFLIFGFSMEKAIITRPECTKDTIGHVHPPEGSRWICTNHGWKRLYDGSGLM